MLFENEYIETCFGSAMHITNDNAAVTMIRNTTFHNNFYSQGASIYLDKGGGFYCKFCTFSMDEKFK